TLSFVALATCADTTSPDPVATQLAIDAALSNVVAGAPMSLHIQMKDAAGQVVVKATGLVTVAIASGTGASGATLQGTLPATADAGEVTFTGLSIEKAGKGYKLEVSASGLTSATSPAFDIAAAAPSQLSIKGGDAQTATAGAAVATLPSVIVK